MSLQRCQQETTSSDFMEWLEYLDKEPNMFHREHHYWATMIAWLQRLTLVTCGKKAIVDDNDCLIKFTVKAVDDKSQTKAAAAKGFFGRLLGVAKAVKGQKKK